MQGHGSSRQGSLRIRSITKDHKYCRVSPREIECESRLGIQEFSVFQQMVTVPYSVSNDKLNLGYPRNRSICLQSLLSVSDLYGLETTSSQSGNSCSPTEMEKSWTSICFSLFLTDRTSFLKSQGRRINNDSSNPKLAYTTLVQSNPTTVQNRACTPVPISRTFGRSQGI